MAIDSFVATLDDVLNFLNSYEEDLFYFDINPSEPPQGARHFSITTFPDSAALRVIDEIHPGPNPPRTTPLAQERIDAAKVDASFACGMNIHPKNNQGWPSVPADLAKVGWVRFPFTSSPAHFPNLEAAFAFFDPVITAYENLGVKIMLVLTHETYGEAAGWNWPTMTSAQWAAFTPQFVNVVTQIVQRYGNRIHAYEVWNEGDAQPDNPAAVYISPRDFAPMLDKTASVIQIYAPESKVILGGLVRSSTVSANYVRDVRSALGGRLPLDAIGVHPYGLGAPNDATVFSRFGSVQATLDAFEAVAPGVPLWFTEVGALGTDNPAFWDDAAFFMRSLYAYLRERAAQVPVVVWYAWSDAMDVAQKTNGVVDKNGKPKPYLYDSFFNVACG